MPETENGPTPACTPAGGDGESLAALPQRFVWWNFAAITLDVACWMAGSACVDPGAVLPVFVSTLTGSKLVVAALTVMPGVGWAALQLIGVSQVMHRPHKKGYLLKIAALGRAPMLVLPVLLLACAPSKATMLWALVGCYAVLFLTDGLIGAAWYDIIAKTIPSGLRGRFFGTMNIVGALGALAAGWVVKRVLASPHLPYPRQYGVLFACMCGGLLLSYLLLAMIREPAGPVCSPERQPVRQVLGQVPRVWRASPALRRLLYVSWLGSVANLAWPFYVLYGMQALGLPTAAGAVFIWAAAGGSMAASLVWAGVNDRRGPRAVIVGVAALRALPPLLALAIPALAATFPGWAAPGTGQYVYGLVFLFTGALAGGGMIGFSSYLLEVAPAPERPLYVGLGNTLAAPGLLAPVLGGWLVSVWSYQPVFLLAGALGLATLTVSLGLEAAGEKR